MKRYALVTLVALLGSCKRDSVATPTPSTPSPTSAPAAAPTEADPWSITQQSKAPPPTTLPRPLLWSITKDGKTSYAFGTMHVGIDVERLPKVVWDKLDASPAFAMETDASDASLLGLGKRTSGSLHEDLGPDYYKKLEALLGPKASFVDKMKPVVAAVMLELRGIQPTLLGMDTALLNKAQTAKKQVLYLEPASKQAALLEKHMDIKALKFMIDTADKSLEFTKSMVAAYVAGDDKKLLELNDSQKPEALAHGYTEAEYDRQSEDMLYERNASWIPAIEQAHAKGGLFVAVGALHLIGKKSVLDLLAAKGYTVTRVP